MISNQLISQTPLLYGSPTEAFLRCLHNEMQRKQIPEPLGKTAQKGGLMSPMKTKQTKGYSGKQSFDRPPGFWAFDINWPTKIIRPTVMAALNGSFVGFHHDT